MKTLPSPKLITIKTQCANLYKANSNKEKVKIEQFYYETVLEPNTKKLGNSPMFLHSLHGTLVFSYPLNVLNVITNNQKIHKQQRRHPQALIVLQDHHQQNNVINNKIRSTLQKSHHTFGEAIP
jgi:hypothetical protein